jgi:hypothetical protein
MTKRGAEVRRIRGNVASGEEVDDFAGEGFSEGVRDERVPPETKSASAT